VYNILDEFILSGEVQESAKPEILDRVRELEKLE
jgi:Clathrin adaptor complex small chain